MERHQAGREVAEFDRLMALRMIAPYAEIPAETLESYWSRWKAEADRNRDAFRAVAKEYEALERGDAVLRLPDGSRWISAGSLLDVITSDEQPDSDNTFLETLHRALLNHKARKSHFGPLLPQVFLDAATLDFGRGFCVECGHWIELMAQSPREAKKPEAE